MAIEQIGDYTYVNFEGTEPLRTPVETIERSIKTLDARHYEAIDTTAAAFANVKIADINAADEPYRRELLQNAQANIDTQVRNGNYAYALSEAKKQARLLATDEGLMNRQKTNQEYQTWRNNLLNSNDYSPEMKEWLLSKNQYNYGENITPEGDFIRKTWDEVKRETGRAEAKQIPVSDIVAQALKYIKPETLGGEAILFRKADGSFTRDINESDPANPLPYLKTGNRTEVLTEDKIRNAALAYINSNADAKASLQQEYDFLMDTNQQSLVGEDGVLKDINSFIVGQITGLSSQAAYRNSISSQNPLDGMKYQAELRMRRIRAAQEANEISQTPYSGYPVNVNIKEIEDYNKLNDRVANTKEELVTRMTALGISDFGERLTQSDIAKLNHVDAASLGYTSQHIQREISSIKRLANDYFLYDQQLNRAKAEVIPTLSTKQREANDFITSLTSGQEIDYNNNSSARDFKNKLNDYIRDKGNILYSPNLRDRVGRDIEAELKAAGIEYNKQGNNYEIVPNLENLYKFAKDFEQDGAFTKSVKRGYKYLLAPNAPVASAVGEAIYDYVSAWNPIDELKGFIKSNNEVSKKSAKAVDKSASYAVNYTALDLKSFVRNDDEAADIRANALAALRNPDARNAIRVYASDAKKGLSFQGDGLEGKLKNDIFDTLFTDAKDVDIRVIPNAKDGEPIYALTFTGEAETKTKEGIANRTFYISGNDVFNTAFNQVTNSPSFIVSSDLARLDIVAHNTTVAVPSTFSGLDDGTLQYSNNNGRRELFDKSHGVTFVNDEIDNIIGSSRIIDDFFNAAVRQNIDLTYQKDALAENLSENGYFLNLVELYTRASYNNPTNRDRQMIANQLYDRFAEKYK